MMKWCWLVVGLAVLVVTGRMRHTSGHVRHKRTIGFLFRSLVDSVISPTGPFYRPPYPDLPRPETPRPPPSPPPSPKPQPQVFLIPYRPDKIQMRPNDLTEIHIHPRLLKQLEALYKAQTIKGKMMVKMITTTPKTEQQTSAASSTPPVTTTGRQPIKYLVQILPDEDKRKGVAISITTNKDGSLRILPPSKKDDKKLQIEEAESLTTTPQPPQPEYPPPLQHDYPPPQLDYPPPHPDYPLYHPLPPPPPRDYPLEHQLIPFGFPLDYPLARSSQCVNNNC